jgi:NAD+ synthase (glutamine-hydrolysing)
MKAALAQLNPIAGDIDGNTRLMLDAVERARSEGADLCVGPELILTGYPPRDLLLRPHFVDANLNALQRIIDASRDITVVVGYVDHIDVPGPGRVNAAAVCRDGELLGVAHKALLPTYDVFDEDRYFEPGGPAQCIPGGIGDMKLGVSVCEDLYCGDLIHGRPQYTRNPIMELVDDGADVMINLSASPYNVGKQKHRLELFTAQAARAGKPLIFVNQVGGNDDLIFDGSSCVLDEHGLLIAHCKSFVEDFCIVDFDRRDDAAINVFPDPIESIRRALILGTRDYIRKCGFTDVVLGLSGGIDSAVTAALAAEALGADRVHGVAMPSRFSSRHSLEDAHALAENLGIEILTVPINDAHEAMERSMTPVFKNTSAGIAEENIQARIRGQIIMALSNKFGWIPLNTGNKSELAVGYCTLYGDMCGSLGVLNDVHKTTVYELAIHINESADRELIPQRSINKAPSAELKPDQTDQDTLPPYIVLDAILERYVERIWSADQIIADGFDQTTVLQTIRRVDMNEYKRRQAPPGLRITSRAFGTGRRMPIASRIPR